MTKSSLFHLTISLCYLWSVFSLPAVAPAQTPVEQHQNRLADETSPYLLQHAHNPVDWYPWGEEAFEKARSENKPIFLSIGYSSCFWCHVMERKVFENEEIAQYMNEYFVNIKVDREERPDIDEIYMLSLQVYFQLAGSTQGGGWPLSLFLTPDGHPIAGGTYFPPEDLPGRPGFMTVMHQLSIAWNEQREAVLRTSAAIAAEVKRLSQPRLSLEAGQTTNADLAAVTEAILNEYDPVHGGFDFSPQTPDKPKFPVPSKLMYMQAQLHRQNDETESIAEKLDHSLQAMANGGIYDHLGGGFHRYSTDRQWLVPHFEKMLYDNAQLAAVYAEAYARTQKEKYRLITEGILEFVLREMTSPEGAFYTALDAETDGVEGEYYVWSQEELQKVFSQSEYRYFASAYGVNEPLQTFEHGKILHFPRPLAETAEQLGISVSELKTRLERSRNELLSHRQKREALRRDEKILTSWNGLMIRAYALAGKALQNREYIARAERAALYVLSHSRSQEGRLLRTASQQRSRLPAYLDDYAFLVSGLLELHEVTGQEKWLNTARLLTDQQLNLFFDDERGGFYFTAHDHEALIARTKSAYDSVLPSGNSVSIENLTRLAQLTGDHSYANAALKTIQAFQDQLRTTPGGLSYFAMATQRYYEKFSPENFSLAKTPLFDGGVSESSAPRKMNQSVNTQHSQLTIHMQTPQELREKSKVTAKGYFDRSVARPGEVVKFLVRIEIDKGWHINANPAQPDFVIPTTLKTNSDSSLVLFRVEYPQGHQFRLQGIEEPLLVYEERVDIKGEFKVPENASSQLNVQFHLQTQACNHQTCFPPVRSLLEGTITVAGENEETQPVNETLFTK